MKSEKKKSNPLLRSNTFILLLVTILVIFVFFMINHNFLTIGNLRSIMFSMGFDGLLVLGVGILLIAGEVDLSSGAVACFSGAIFGLMCNMGVPWGLSLVLTVLIGIGCGTLHAFLVNDLKFMGFMATLAMAQVYRGFVSMLLENKNIQILNQGMRVLGNTLGEIPIPFVILIILLAIYAVILSRRKLGRAIYLVGGNRDAARLCGVSPKRISYFVYINSAALCSLAGIITTARMHTASPSTGNAGETDAITAAVLGGISFMGGVGSVAGCFIGVMLLDFFNSGLTAIGFPSYWQIVAKGVLLVLALAIDFISTSRKRKLLEAAA